MSPESRGSEVVMSTPTVLERKQPIVYPGSDGQPMAENTLQFRWIVTIEGGLEALYRDDPNVFVAGDLLWYPVEGDNTIRQAPDAMVVFGRPRGDRGSYRQWEEDHIAPHVVFEVLSPGNRFGELQRKFGFYQRYGVQEYYIYDPDGGDLFGWLREGDQLREVPSMQGWVSPLLKVRFAVENGELRLEGPDGRRFASYVELAAQREQAQREAAEARQLAERQAAEIERLQAELKAVRGNGN